MSLTRMRVWRSFVTFIVSVFPYQLLRTFSMNDGVSDL